MLFRKVKGKIMSFVIVDFVKLLFIVNIIRVLKIFIVVLLLLNFGVVSCRFVRDEYCFRYERRFLLDVNLSINISVFEGLKINFRYYFNYKKN